MRLQLSNQEASLLKAFLDDVGTLPDFAHIRSMEATTVGHLGNTPLHVAAIRGDYESTCLLVKAGVEFDARGEHGFTPLHEAVLSGNVEVVAVLVAAGASKNSLNDYQERPIDLAFLANDKNTGFQIASLLMDED